MKINMKYLMLWNTWCAQEKKWNHGEGNPSCLPFELFNSKRKGETSQMGSGQIALNKASLQCLPVSLYRKTKYKNRNHDSSNNWLPKCVSMCICNKSRGKASDQIYILPSPLATFMLQLYNSAKKQKESFRI